VKKPLKIIILVATVLLVAAVFSGCSSRFVSVKEGATRTSSPAPGNQKPAGGQVQTDEQGSVTIEVEWAGAEGDAMVFNVSLNTHSVDLDGYDLAEMAVLRDDTGNEYQPILWDAASGGHHRQGVLTFPLPDSVKRGTARHVEMVIRGVAGIDERVLTWEL